MRHNELDFEITDICFERKSVRTFFPLDTNHYQYILIIYI